jgi:hypothetical protein
VNVTLDLILDALAKGHQIECRRFVGRPNDGSMIYVLCVGRERVLIRPDVFYQAMMDHQEGTLERSENYWRGASNSELVYYYRMR